MREGSQTILADLTMNNNAKLPPLNHKSICYLFDKQILL